MSEKRIKCIESGQYGSSINPPSILRQRVEKKQKKKPRKRITNKQFRQKRDVSVKYAEELREKKTMWESILREALDYYGIKYIFQYPFTNGKNIFIFDFMIPCASTRLCVEVDGGYHRARKKQDSKRSKIIGKSGFDVIRFWNSEVESNLDYVIGAILARNPKRYRNYEAKQ